MLGGGFLARQALTFMFVTQSTVAPSFFFFFLHRKYDTTNPFCRRLVCHTYSAENNTRTAAAPALLTRFLFLQAIYLTQLPSEEP